MSAPQQISQKSHRKTPRKPQNAGQTPRSVVSDNDAYTALGENNAIAGEGKQRPRRKSHAAKKGYIQNDAAAYSDGPAQRSGTHPIKTQATPIKQQAYAGPTFHQSPAASALPMPSFYSKSLPVASPIKPGLDGTQSPSKNAPELSQVVPSLPAEPKRESTPLDFLFDAARKASATPGAESPNHKHYLSSAANTPASRSPAVREGDSDFPFELDSGEQQTVWNTESTLSTPYKDRIEAARTQRTSSTGGKGLEEDERKAKTAALKQFLMSSAQHSGEAADNNIFNAKSAPPQRQYQHRSNPNTPYNGGASGNQYFPPMPPMPHVAHYQSPSRAGPPSNLRNVYQPGPDATSMRPTDSPEQMRISTARDQTPARSNYADIYNTPSRPKDSGAGHRATPSAQQLEDDLRKFLKLDLISSG